MRVTRLGPIAFVIVAKFRQVSQLFAHIYRLFVIPIPLTTLLKTEVVEFAKLR